MKYNTTAEAVEKLITARGPMKPADIAQELNMPIGTVYGVRTTYPETFVTLGGDYYALLPRNGNGVKEEGVPRELITPAQVADALVRRMLAAEQELEVMRAQNAELLLEKLEWDKAKGASSRPEDWQKTVGGL